MNIDLTLAEFISDFKLQKFEQALSFRAAVIFHSQNFHKEFTSEIHIVCINAKKSQALYLTNPAEELGNIPDMYVDCKYQYEKYKFLYLYGTCHIHGQYYLAITPELFII